MANQKSNEVVNGTPSHEQLEATQGDTTKKLGQQGTKKKGRPKKKENLGSPTTPRVLRSRSQEKPKPPESVDASSQSVDTKEKKRKKIIKKIKEDQNDEFSKIRKHLRYLLNKINYEKLFIDAYVGEGWKGQSLEKLRPEKELQRAKSDINRFKLRIRDLFQKIDKSCEEGRFPDTLYDSDGLIDSEDIFCAKCAQTEVKLDNDIILCDGFCDRGFHQFCLQPPLLKEQVPPGDEGWLCPACDCKVDCIDLLNDSMGTDLSINDTWEKVFPESVGGNTLDDLSGLPSDDSEDDDYTPGDGPGVEENGVDVEDPSSDDDDDDSDFSSASEDLEAVVTNNNNSNSINNNEDQYLGLLSDDSEDDDFNPDKPDSDDDGDNDKTKNSGSDFSSDSEDLADVSKDEVMSGEVKETVVSEKDEEGVKTDVENDDSGPITARRHVQRLDYKKLHDEAYGNASSDSSDDEDFSESEGPKRQKNTKGKKDSDSNKKNKESDTTTPVRSNGKKVDVEGKNGTSARKGSDDKSKSGAKSSNKKLGEAVTQRLYEIFKENRYPDRKTKDNLTQELNLTLNQVSKWFENARRSFNQTGQHHSKPATPTPVKTTTTTTHSNGEISTAKKSSKRKAKTDNEDTKDTNSKNTYNSTSPMDLSSQSARRSGRVRAKRL
ncbi:hypothetical protein LXL04_017362 [Taraxacum kok-saghyz]